LACYVGSELVFDKASEALEKIGGIHLCDKQIERICHYYGQKLEDEISQKVAESAAVKVFPYQSPTTCMVDGGMVFTRDQGWKEMKLMRMFQDKECVSLSDKRNWIHESLYVAHLGEHDDFCRKAEVYLDPIWDLTFVADGASWIWNWVEAVFPESTQILDFYHASEHLWAFANVYFKPEEARRKHQWINKQIECLLEDKVHKVIKAIERLPAKGRNGSKDAQKSIIGYYQNNLHRMQYKTFRDDGLMIGSGPIESAHKNVIQQRLKLSGQKWTISGAQQIANLRATRLSGNWGEVQELIKKAA
jgi:hypothetical protein